MLIMTRFNSLQFVTVLFCFIVTFSACSQSSSILSDPGVVLPEQKTSNPPSQQAIALKDQGIALIFKLINAGRIEELPQGLVLFDEALKIDPNAHVIYAQKAGFLLSFKKYPEAAEAFSKAISIRPHAAEYYLGQAFALARMGKENQAKESCRYAIAAFNLRLQDNPKDPLVRTNRAMVVFLLGYHDLALAELNDVLAKDPGQETAKIVRISIEKTPTDDPWKILGFE